MEENRLLKIYQKWEKSVLFVDKDETLELEEFRSILKNVDENETVEAILKMSKYGIGDRFLKEVAKISPRASQVLKILKAKVDEEPKMKRFLLRCISVIESNLIG